jgi:hypothetical protein
MEKRYSIKNAFTATFSTLLMYKTEFFKLIAISLLFQLPSIFLLVTQSTSIALKALAGGLNLLSFIFMLTCIVMFFQVFKDEQVSFVKALNKATTVKIIRNFLLLCLMYVGALMSFIVPLTLAVILINSYLAISYAYIINGILITACVFPGIYYLIRYLMFALSALIDGNTVLESIKKSYTMTSLKMVLIVLGYSCLLALPFLILSGIAIASLSIVGIITMNIIFLLMNILIKPIATGTMVNLYMQLKDQ